MAERKVLNKYYPPDFDPEKLQRLKRFSLANQDGSSRRKRRREERKGKQMNVRMMFPFTFRCSTCHEFTYVGTKFNSRVEKVQGEDYLGLIIWRFYGRCPSCRAEVSFKTDPKNADYILEFGGVRTYDARRDAEIAERTLKELYESEVGGDKMKEIEHKSYNTAMELQEIEQLSELKRINKRLADGYATTEAAISFLYRKKNPESLLSDEQKAILLAEEESELQLFQKQIANNVKQYLDECTDAEDDICDILSNDENNFPNEILDGIKTHKEGEKHNEYKEMNNKKEYVEGSVTPKNGNASMANVGNCDSQVDSTRMDTSSNICRTATDSVNPIDASNNYQADSLVVSYENQQIENTKNEPIFFNRTKNTANTSFFKTNKMGNMKVVVKKKIANSNSISSLFGDYASDDDIK